LLVILILTEVIKYSAKIGKEKIYSRYLTNKINIYPEDLIRHKERIDVNNREFPKLLFGNLNITVPFIRSYRNKVDYDEVWENPMDGDIRRYQMEYRRR